MGNFQRNATVSLKKFYFETAELPLPECRSSYCFYPTVETPCLLFGNFRSHPPPRPSSIHLLPPTPLLGSLSVNLLTILQPFPPPSPYLLEDTECNRPPNNELKFFTYKQDSLCTVLPASQLSRNSNPHLNP